MKIFHEKVDSTSYKCWLEICEPNADVAGLYKCLIKNTKGQLFANLNLNIEGELAWSDQAKTTNNAPTFVEKPKIVTHDDGELIQLVCHYKASSKCNCKWYYKETIIQKSQTMRMFHEK